MEGVSPFQNALFAPLSLAYAKLAAAHVASE